MEFLWWFCKGIGLVTLSMFFLTILYAILSTLIENVAEDITNMKKYIELKKDYQELLEKVQRLEIELVDKKLTEEYNNNKGTKN